jgi:hypothetical protein
MMTRRDLFRLGASAALAAALPRGLAAGDPPSPPPALPPGRARAVIQVWLWGGPSHLDTFDPKPTAGRDFHGPLGKPIPTSVDGLLIGQSLPLLAQQMHRCAVLRGMTHGSNGHETAAYLMQAARQAGDGLSWPGLGAVVSKLRGYEAGYRGLLPPYITLTTPQGRFSECGFLGGRHRPFATGGDPAAETFAVDGMAVQGLGDERQKSRRELLGGLDRFATAHPEDATVRELLACREQAYELILGDAGAAYDLSREDAALRDRYGRNRLGQSCLLARRLVEAGVPYVTVNANGWDTHKRHFEAMNRMLPQLDAAVATLLEDLAQRGLLDSTIVWVGGEFGRTPRVLWEPPWEGGRGHHGKAFSHLLAGGGVRGGTVVGATDERGEAVVQRQIWPWDLFATMCGLLGLPGDTQLALPQGGSVPLLTDPPAGRSGGVLREVV